MYILVNNTTNLPGKVYRCPLVEGTTYFTILTPAEYAFYMVKHTPSSVYPREDRRGIVVDLWVFENKEYYDAMVSYVYTCSI